MTETTADRTPTTKTPQAQRARPTVRGLVREALAKPTDANGEPVYGIAGYCENPDCDVRWHQRLVTDLQGLRPIPRRLRCPGCHRWLWNYRLRDHWPTTGEDMGCPFHQNTKPVLRSVRKIGPPVPVEEYVAR